MSSLLLLSVSTVTVQSSEFKVQCFKERGSGPTSGDWTSAGLGPVKKLPGDLVQSSEFRVQSLEAEEVVGARPVHITSQLGLVALRRLRARQGLGGDVGGCRGAVGGAGGWRSDAAAAGVGARCWRGGGRSKQGARPPQVIRCV